MKRVGNRIRHRRIQRIRDAVVAELPRSGFLINGRAYTATDRISTLTGLRTSIIETYAKYHQAELAAVGVKASHSNIGGWGLRIDETPDPDAQEDDE